MRLSNCTERETERERQRDRERETDRQTEVKIIRKCPNGSQMRKTQNVLGKCEYFIDR